MSGLRDPQWRIAQPVKHGSEPAQHQGSPGRHISNRSTMRATDPINVSGGSTVSNSVCYAVGET